MKFAYHEIELTRRCNLKCEHCMRGDMQPLDISDEDLKTFFMGTSYIESLTLTGGEVSLVPHKMETTLSLAKLLKTEIGHMGMLINGQVVSDRFIAACRAWKEYVPSFGIEIAADPYHKPIPLKNLIKLTNMGVRLQHRDNKYILNSGRAKGRIPWAMPWTCQTKPYWFLNGMVMEPTYLNAKGNFVAIDGSYEDQDELTLGHVSEMSYDLFIKEDMKWYVPSTDPMGINGGWPVERMVAAATKGQPGLTYFHEEVYHVQELIKGTKVEKFQIGKYQPMDEPEMVLNFQIMDMGTS